MHILCARTACQEHWSDGPEIIIRFSVKRDSHIARSNHFWLPYGHLLISQVNRMCAAKHFVLISCTQPRRHGFGGPSSANKLQAPTLKYETPWISGVFVNSKNVKHSCADESSPFDNFLATVLHIQYIIPLRLLFCGVIFVIWLQKTLWIICFVFISIQDLRLQNSDLSICPER